MTQHIHTHSVSSVIVKQSSHDVAVDDPVE
jgi:hypothetical protein